MNHRQDQSVQSEPRKGPGKFPIKIAVMTLLIAAVVVSGLILRRQQYRALGAESREHFTPTVAVVSPKPGQPTAELSLPAEIKPWVEAPLYARANGYLKRRFVDIGTHVNEGQGLAEIDTPELNQELERTRGQLAQAEAVLGLSRITAARWAGLVKTASVSEQDNAEKQADLKLKLALAESAHAEVRRLEKLQGFARVVAPFSGTVTVRNVDRGDLIAIGGSKELFHMAQTNKLRIYVQVPQKMARSISAGQMAELILPELPGRIFPAKVIATAGVISADSRTLPVELEVDNEKGTILAGGYAQVRFADVKTTPSLTLPANTVFFHAEGPQVDIVTTEGKVEVRGVKLGRDFGQTIEILAGVAPDDRVIVNPAESFVTGTAVGITEPAKTGKKQ